MLHVASVSALGYIRKHRIGILLAVERIAHTLFVSVADTVCVAVYLIRERISVAMSRDHPLAVRFRAAQDATSPRLSNRDIAKMADISPPTVDRLMKGQVDTQLKNIDAVADILKVPRREARKLAKLPPTDGDPYTGPEESRLLDRKQRAALDELIRSFVSAPSIRDPGSPHDPELGDGPTIWPARTGEESGVGGD